MYMYIVRGEGGGGGFLFNATTEGVYDLSLY